MSDWTHAPIHRTSTAGWYFMTAGTYLKRPYLKEEKRRYDFVALLKRIAAELTIELQAWVVMVNHYHLMIRSTEPDTVLPFIRKVHSINAHDVNAADATLGRRVWYQYWDIAVRTEPAYLAHIKYIHCNPEHHGIVRHPDNYIWSSSRGFAERHRTLARAVEQMKIDSLDVHDDF